jgi:hypothetical protein
LKQKQASRLGEASMEGIEEVKFIESWNINNIDPLILPP